MYQANLFHNQILPEDMIYNLGIGLDSLLIEG
jgi:hypothetical protein